MLSVITQALEDLRTIRDRGSASFTTTRLRELEVLGFVIVRWTRSILPTGPRLVPATVRLTFEAKALLAKLEAAA